jgi:hypothetical protein
MMTPQIEARVANAMRDQTLTESKGFKIGDQVKWKLDGDLTRAATAGEVIGFDTDGDPITDLQGAIFAEDLEVVGTEERLVFDEIVALSTDGLRQAIRDTAQRLRNLEAEARHRHKDRQETETRAFEAEMAQLLGGSK